MQPLVVVNSVALPLKHLRHAPRLQQLANAGWARPSREAFPAVTCTAQASMLTGKTASQHGIVGNGWLFRDTMEVRFWQQSNRLLQAEPVYATARREAERQGRQFRCAKLFWWFNQGADVDIAVTPKPYYGADGGKAFDIQSYPEEWTPRLKSKLGNFPFMTFWGPMAGLGCTQWIARCAAEVLRDAQGPPDLTLVYLPHLDYDTQRLGPEACDWAKLAGELDAACAPLLDAAKSVGARVWVVNEYTHVQVSRPIYLNRILREAGWLVARAGPFGESLETHASRAFAVCDHQVAHVYVRDARDMPRVREIVANAPGVAQTWAGAEREAVGQAHERAGDIVALAQREAWFAYPYWLDDRLAPDFARTVDIHRKPGYDPCELFFDPKLWFPKLRVARRILRKKLGFRMLLDVVPLDASLVRGSHGRVMDDADARPVMIGDGPAPGAEVPMTGVRELLLAALGVGDARG